MNHPVAVVFLCIAAYGATCGAQTNPARDADQASPIAFDVPNIKRGKQFYAVHCVSCHGADGRGDTEMREFLKIPPADLTDDAWIHGGSQQAMFDVVKQGRAEREMPAFGDQLTDDRIWQVVNYLQYLGGRRP